MKLPNNTYVRVYEGHLSWYGQITNYSEVNKTYKIRVGGTNSEVDVPAKQVALHPAFVASGGVPSNVFPRRATVGGDIWLYHITSKRNMESIYNQGGLVPKCYAQGDFGGLDSYINKDDKAEDISARLNSIFEAAEKFPDGQAIFEKWYTDAVLGGKEEFIFAAKSAAKIFKYASILNDQANQPYLHLIIFRFKAKGHIWYFDLEDEGGNALKSPSRVGLNELSIICHGKQKNNEQELNDHLLNSTWRGCSEVSSELEIRFELLNLL